MEKYLSKFENQTAALSNQEELTSPHVSLLEAEEEVVYSGSETYGSKIKFEKDEATGKLYFVVEGPSYEMIDLGLSVKWANMNVGAETPQDNGLYFDWGNVDGHAVDEEGNVVDYSFDKTTYASTLGGQYTGSKLDAEHDAATVNMGSDWRMPTYREITELVENTQHYYISLDGTVVGGPFNYNTSSSDKGLDGSKLRSICFVKKGDTFDYNNRSNFIEFPFAGYCSGGLLGSEGLNGVVWSSSVSGSYARNLLVSSSGNVLGVGSLFRYFGLSVRGVHA